MPGKMKSACAGCGGEILYAKDSTGQEVIQASPDEYADLCGTCKAKRHASGRESVEPAGQIADFDDERNRAMRTGGTDGRAD
jgi:hypothetical protein